MQRYAGIAFLFALVWASIQYTQGRIMDFRVLGVTVLVFVVLGTVLCWGMEKLIRWFKQRR
jgi:hypothetical protein